MDFLKSMLRKPDSKKMIDCLATEGVVLKMVVEVTLEQKKTVMKVQVYLGGRVLQQVIF